MAAIGWILLAFFAIWLSGLLVYMAFVYSPLVALFSQVTYENRTHKIRRKLMINGLLWPIRFRKVKSLAVEAEAATRVLRKK